MSQLLGISIDFLYAGMEVVDNIYSHDGKVVLVCTGDILDGNKIKRLRKFNQNKGNISVQKRTYEHLIQHMEEQKQSDEVKAQRVYERTSV